MKNFLAASIAVFLLIFGSSCQKKNPEVEIQTPKGKIVIELYTDRAPVTAGNFLRLVKEGVYDGSFFYRSVRGTSDSSPIPISVVQGGVMNNENPPKVDPIPHESTDQTGVKHLNGVISMARSAPGSASSEFFICMGDQPELDSRGRRNPDGQGFAAFGQVIEGWSVLQAVWGAPAIGEKLDPYIPIHTIKVR